MTDSPDPPKVRKKRGVKLGSQRGAYRKTFQAEPLTVEECVREFEARRALIEMGHTMTSDMVRGLLAAAVVRMYDQLPELILASALDYTLMLQFLDGLTKVAHDIRGVNIQAGTKDDSNKVVLGKFGSARQYMEGTTGAPVKNGNGANGGGDPSSGSAPGWS